MNKQISERTIPYTCGNKKDEEKMCRHARGERKKRATVQTQCHFKIACKFGIIFANKQKIRFDFIPLILCLHALSFRSDFLSKEMKLHLTLCLALSVRWMAKLYVWPVCEMWTNMVHHSKATEQPQWSLFHIEKRARLKSQPMDIHMLQMMK